MHTETHQTQMNDLWWFIHHIRSATFSLDGIKQALVSENCVDILQEIVSTNTSSNNKEDVLEKLKISVDLIILLLGDGELDKSILK